MKFSTKDLHRTIEHEGQGAVGSKCKCALDAEALGACFGTVEKTPAQKRMT